MSEELVMVPYGRGALAGVLHRPTLAEAHSRAVLMPPAGLRDKSGPMRLYTRLARRLALEGHYVLRYDGAGTGESGGPPPAPIREAAYAAVRSGHRFDEVLAARAHLSAESRCSRVVVLGLCGAVYDAAHLAARAPHGLAGIFGIGAPTLVPQRVRGGAELLTASDMSHSWLERSFAQYLQRARDPGAWRRLVGGKSDYRRMARAIGATLGRGLSWRALRRERKSRGYLPGEVAERALAGLARADERVDRGTWEPLVRLRASGVRVDLAWGEHDPSGYAFEDFLRRPIPEMGELFARHVIAGGGHECASHEAFDTLARTVIAFVASVREEGGGAR